jgi:hypothetical protein
MTTPTRLKFSLQLTTHYPGNFIRNPNLTSHLQYYTLLPSPATLTVRMLSD